MEWTVLSAFIIEDIVQQDYQIVSLATGTKSLPKSLMNSDGYCLNDCHAEILA